MGAVFVSYRRGDSEGQARALFLELGTLLGRDSVFMDVDGIALGRDFRQAVQERLGSCDVMLALIGPGWLDARDGAGQRRLDTPTDFVRQEIAAALKRNIPVIPVLVQGAQMPQPERLPDDLKDLSYRNGFELDHTTWESDVREMVKRLGLSAATPSRSAAPPIGETTPSEVFTDSAPLPWRRYRLPAVIALVAGAAGLLGYLNLGMSGDEPVKEITPPPQLAKETVSLSAGVASMAVLPAPAAGGGLAGAGIEFFWPGDDCWEVFRGAELVASHCGAKSQALGAGHYSVRPKHAPVFLPFDVDVKAGEATKIALGGVFEFTWPGDDCWDIMRGDEFVGNECGTKRQALSAGRYTIKGRHAPVFTPFTIEVKDGFSTKMAKGDILEFAWPGGDCWDIFRGAELVKSQCGAKKQALDAGRYTIKGKHAPVFPPFDVTITPGTPTKVARGGVFEFAWPGSDCWDVFRGEQFVASQCGHQKQALAAGRYTIKGKHKPVFNPFEITIDDGKVVKAP